MYVCQCAFVGGRTGCTRSQLGNVPILRQLGRPISLFGLGWPNLVGLNSRDAILGHCFSILDVIRQFETIAGPTKDA